MNSTTATSPPPLLTTTTTTSSPQPPPPPHLLPFSLSLSISLSLSLSLSLSISLSQIHHHLLLKLITKHFKDLNTLKQILEVLQLKGLIKQREIREKMRQRDRVVSDGRDDG
ncbi:hypothetical protein HanIR_Chr09g0400521 [Helianthus annuus]|nr:hypothetical protein HanIR_Chr09g0400521 [Helianthus annuus]